MKRIVVLFFSIVASITGICADNAVEKIAFISDRDEKGWQIYVMDTDSSSQKRITDIPGIDFFRISASPDGKKILAAAGPITSADMIIDKSDLYMLDVNGGKPLRLTDDKAIQDSPGWFPSGKKIIFSSNEKGYYGIYTADADGKNIKPLTGGKFNDMNPSVSPDGKKIVFESDKTEKDTGSPDEQLSYEEYDEYDVPDGKRIPYNNDGSSKIYIMDSDGKNRKRLTNQGGIHTRPFWSADGKKIYYFSGYVADSMTRRVTLEYMDADGKNKQTWIGLPDNTPDSASIWINNGENIILPIKHPDNGSGRSLYVLDTELKPFMFMEYSDESNFEPCLLSALPQKSLAWKKPEKKLGGLIAHRAEAKGGYNIFISEPDGTNRIKLTETNTAFSPCISKDRTKIAYSDQGDQADGLSYQVYIMNIDGSGKKKITSGAMAKMQPRWSPDGSKLLFIRFVTGNRSEICLMNSDGTGIRALTNHTYLNRDPCWSPDGKQIVFSSERNGYAELFIMDADGGHERQLTINRDKRSAVTPAWSPDGRVIVFSRNGSFWSINPDGTDEKQMYCKQGGTQPAWSPDGKNIAFKTPDRNKGVMIMDADCGNAVDMDTRVNSGIYDIDGPSWE